MLIHSSLGHEVLCREDCEVGYKTREEAIEAWNRRPIAQEVREPDLILDETGNRETGYSAGHEDGWNACDSDAKRQLSALTLKLQEAEKSWELWKGRFDKIHNIVSKDGDCTVTEVIERVSALTKENKDLKEALDYQKGRIKRLLTTDGRGVEYKKQLLAELLTEASEIKSAQSMERNKEGKRE